MRHPMSLKARNELLASTAVRYQKSSKKEKQTILDKFPNGQLRTFQRRVKDWRVEQATGRIGGEITAIVLSTIPSNGDFG